MAYRCGSIGSILLAVGCFALFGADVAELSGRWQVDPGNSKFGNEKTLALDIRQQGNQISFKRTYQDEDGKQATASFTCSTDGKQCDFNENGRKAKVSVWYNGPDLVVLKTDGEKHDSTVEWHIKLSDDRNSMTVSRETMAPSESKEQLVFTKTNSVASR